MGLFSGDFIMYSDVQRSPKDLSSEKPNFNREVTLKRVICSAGEINDKSLDRTCLYNFQAAVTTTKDGGERAKQDKPSYFYDASSQSEKSQ